MVSWKCWESSFISIYELISYNHKFLKMEINIKKDVNENNKKGMINVFNKIASSLVLFYVASPHAFTKLIAQLNENHQWWDFSQKIVMSNFFKTADVEA